MKIESTHLEFMQNAIADFDTPAAAALYKSKGLTPKRYRWDCLYKAGLSKWICDNLYSYMNDTHIDTALRNIIKNYS